MDRLARFVLKIAIASLLCCIIDAWWTMAEVNLYGYSQVSIIDALAAGTMAFGIADLLLRGE